MLRENEFLKDIIGEDRQFVLSSHLMPDMDSTTSLLVAKEILKLFNPDVETEIVYERSEQSRVKRLVELITGGNYGYTNLDRIDNKEDKVLFLLDVSDPKRFYIPAEHFKEFKRVIIIDHHTLKIEGKELYEQYEIDKDKLKSYIKVDEISTGCVLGELICPKDNSIEFCRELDESSSTFLRLIYAGLMSDSKGFELSSSVSNFIKGTIESIHPEVTEHLRDIYFSNDPKQEYLLQLTVNSKTDIYEKDLSFLSINRNIIEATGTELDFEFFKETFMREMGKSLLNIVVFRYPFIDSKDKQPKYKCSVLSKEYDTRVITEPMGGGGHAERGSFIIQQPTPQEEILERVKALIQSKTLDFGE